MSEPISQGLESRWGPFVAQESCVRACIIYCRVLSQRWFFKPRGNRCFLFYFFFFLRRTITKLRTKGVITRVTHAGASINLDSDNGEKVLNARCSYLEDKTVKAFALATWISRRRRASVYSNCVPTTFSYLVNRIKDQKCGFYIKPIPVPDSDKFAQGRNWLELVATATVFW